MRKAHRRRRFGDPSESLETLNAIKERVLGGYPKIVLARKRTALVGTLLKLADQLAVGLSELAAMPMPTDRDSTPAFLKADRPIAALRAFRVELLEMFCKGVPGGAENPDVAELRARLAKEPGPGGEIIDAGEMLVWFLQWYLFIQLQVEATSTSDLPSQDPDTHIDEAARDEISMARKDMTLARMRTFIGLDDPGGGEISLNGIAHRVGRRRRQIEVLMDAFFGSFQEAVEQQIRVATACCGENSREAGDLRALRDSLKDPSDPRVRALFQQWLKVPMHMETADPETVTLAQEGTVPGPLSTLPSQGQRRKPRRRRGQGRARRRAANSTLLTPMSGTAR